MRCCRWNSRTWPVGPVAVGPAEPADLPAPEVTAVEDEAVRGVEASFTVDGDGPVDLRVADGSDGLTGLPGSRPRPDGVDAAGTHSFELVVVSATASLGRSPTT